MPADPTPLTAKGLRSREAILSAAAERFETDGFDGTTIRAIARAAGIDPAMVVRYFGSKERLFLAATTIDLALPSLDAVPVDQLGATLARHAVALWHSEQPGRALRILLRAAATDPEAAARVRGVFLDQVLPLLARHPDGELRAGLVSAQILGYAFGRYVAHLPPLDAVEADEAARLLGAALQAVISAP
ncbi:TetR/AcrR family transcriptional regulator [Nocardioides zeae]